MKTLDIHIRERLRIIRTKKGLTADALASMVGLSQASICRMENGAQQISLRQLNQFSEAFSISLKLFFVGIGGGADEMPLAEFSTIVDRYLQNQRVLTNKMKSISESLSATPVAQYSMCGIIQ